MTIFSKETEQFIEHEVQLRLHEEKFHFLDNSIDRLDESIKHLDNKMDAGLKHLDNKFMLMFSLILGSIWIPAIIKYLLGV